MMRKIDGKDIVLKTNVPVTQGKTTFSNEICEDIDVLDPESVEEDLYKYKARNDRFAPVPSARKYIDLEEDCTFELDEEMVIGPYEEILPIFHRIYEYPFLLVDHYHNHEFHIFEESDDEQDIAQLNNEPEKALSYEGIVEQFPSVQEEFQLSSEKRYGIITLSELNKRKIREHFYPIIAEFEKSIAGEIKEEYPRSEDLTEAVGRAAERAWEQNRNTDAEVHISEFLGLKDMENLVSDSRTLATACGFETEKQIDDFSEVEELGDLRALDPEEVLSEIRDLRNKTMHANRVLVQDVDDLGHIINQYNLLCAFIDEISDQMYLSKIDSNGDS
ncbi:hypothetical protein ACT4ML_10165 [Natrinema sp. LN54]|uniref:hypothetical protein n=1 Tax=Natrinema sp. LN54 TaxID=3458705 RepID=UPI004035160F